MGLTANGRMSIVIMTGLLGMLGAILTGAGEFILHFDSLARFGSEFEYFGGISDQRTNYGHFIAVLGGPLYLIGCWHIHLMLKPANEAWAKAAFYIAAYGFAVGIVWIGSRASISAIINMPPSAESLHLVELYNLRYETLLQVIRFTTLLLSVIFVRLVLTGRSHYPKWMAALNPILLILMSFLIYVIAPDLGKYLMPIALNVAFFILFLASILVANKKGL